MSLSAKASGSTLVFSLHQLRFCPPKPIAWNRCGLFSPLRTATQPPLSAPTCHRAAPHTPLHSPTAGGATRPASGPPLPPLSSSHSSHRVRRAAAHTVVGPCPVPTAPGYTARV